MTPDPTDEMPELHKHPQYVAWSGCAACIEEGEEALLKMADRIRAKRDESRLLREGYEAYKDWKWGDA